MGDLSYTLDGYDYRAASAFCVQRMLPAWLRNRTWIFLALLLVWVGLALALASLKIDFGALIFLPGLLAYLWFVYASAQARKRLWHGMAEAPGRAGPIALRLDDAGVHLAGPGFRTSYDWARLHDAQAGPDGLLLMTGPCEFAPIPARAFADKAAETAALTDLQTRIAAAKGARP